MASVIDHSHSASAAFVYLFSAILLLLILFGGALTIRFYNRGDISGRFPALLLFNAACSLLFAIFAIAAVSSTLNHAVIIIFLIPCSGIAFTVQLLRAIRLWFTTEVRYFMSKQLQHQFVYGDVEGDMFAPGNFDDLEQYSDSRSYDNEDSRLMDDDDLYFGVHQGDNYDEQSITYSASYGDYRDIAVSDSDSMESVGSHPSTEAVPADAHKRQLSHGANPAADNNSQATDDSNSLNGSLDQDDDLSTLLGAWIFEHKSFASATFMTGFATFVFAKYVILTVLFTTATSLRYSWILWLVLYCMAVFSCILTVASLKMTRIRAYYIYERQYDEWRSQYAISDEQDKNEVGGAVAVAGALPNNAAPRPTDASDMSSNGQPSSTKVNSRTGGATADIAESSHSDSESGSRTARNRSESSSHSHRSRGASAQHGDKRHKIPTSRNNLRQSSNIRNGGSSTNARFSSKKDGNSTTIELAQHSQDFDLDPNAPPPPVAPPTTLFTSSNDPSGQLMELLISALSSGIFYIICLVMSIVYSAIHDNAEYYGYFVLTPTKHSPTFTRVLLIFLVIANIVIVYLSIVHPIVGDQLASVKYLFGGSQRLSMEASDMEQLDNLTKILEDSQARAEFHKFLDGEFSAENLLFWSAIEEYRTRPTAHFHNRTDTINSAKYIFSTYLAPGAVYEVNISSQCRERISIRLRELLEKDPLDQIRELETQEITSAYQDFLRSGAIYHTFILDENQIFTTQELGDPVEEASQPRGARALANVVINEFGAQINSGRVGLPPYSTSALEQYVTPQMHEIYESMARLLVSLGSNPTTVVPDAKGPGDDAANNRVHVIDDQRGQAPLPPPAPVPSIVYKPDSQTTSRHVAQDVSSDEDNENTEQLEQQDQQQQHISPNATLDNIITMLHSASPQFDPVNGSLALNIQPVRASTTPAAVDDIALDYSALRRENGHAEWSYTYSDDEHHEASRSGSLSDEDLGYANDSDDDNSDTLDQQRARRYRHNAALDELHTRLVKASTKRMLHAKEQREIDAMISRVLHQEDMIRRLENLPVNEEESYDFYGLVFNALPRPVDPLAPYAAPPEPPAHIRRRRRPARMANGDAAQGQGNAVAPNGGATQGTRLVHALMSFRWKVHAAYRRLQQHVIVVDELVAVFDQAQKEIFKLMERDSYARFVKTTEFQQFVSARKKAQNAQNAQAE